MRVRSANDLEHLKTAAARHLFVEKHEVVGRFSDELERIISVRDGVHVITARLKEQQVRLQQVDFVIDPQDALLWTGVLGHGGKLSEGSIEQHPQPLRQFVAHLAERLDIVVCTPIRCGVG